MVQPPRRLTLLISSGQHRPEIGLCLVNFGPGSACVHRAEPLLGFRQAQFSSFAIPTKCFSVVPPNTPALFVKLRESELSTRQTLTRSLKIVLRSQLKILPDPVTVLVELCYLNLGM